MAEILTDSELAEIEVREKRATPPPWIPHTYNWPIGDTGDYEPCAQVLAAHGNIQEPREIALFHELTSNNSAQVANCAFASNARTDIPRLIASHRALAAETEELAQRLMASADRNGELLLRIRTLESACEAALKGLQSTFDYYMSDEACGDFTCACGDIERCGMCQMRKSTRSTIEQLEGAIKHG